jgi:hypothetical protein
MSTVQTPPIDSVQVGEFLASCAIEFCGAPCGPWIHPSQFGDLPSRNV